MNNTTIKIIKASISSLIVALFIVFMLISGIILFYGQKMDDVITLAKMVTVDESKKANTETVIEKIDQKIKLKNYPEYGTKYATIEIPRIESNLPVYFGDTLEVLKKGVGHSSGSYFPGEGGSIIYMGHNSKNVYRRFSELQLGDEIFVKTSYGEFKYKIYDMQIVKETELEKLPIQREQEVLMVYTCYPFNNVGYTTQRYVVYART